MKNLLNPVNQISKAREWQHKLLWLATGLLLFETLTGLSIWLLPFSVSNQITVLLHTVVDLVFIIPYAWYQIRHWRIYREMSMTHVKLTGYFSLAATLVATISGLVLTYQAVFQTKISSGWDWAHLISTFALIAALLPHVLCGRSLRTQFESCLLFQASFNTKTRRKTRKHGDFNWAFSAVFYSVYLCARPTGVADAPC